MNTITTSLTYETLVWMLIAINFVLLVGLSACVFRIAKLKIWHNGDLEELSNGKYSKKPTKRLTIVAITCGVLMYVCITVVAILVGFQTVRIS